MQSTKKITRECQKKKRVTREQSEIENVCPFIKHVPYFSLHVTNFYSTLLVQNQEINHRNCLPTDH